MQTQRTTHPAKQGRRTKHPLLRFALCLFLCGVLLPIPTAVPARAEGEKLIAFTFDDGPSDNTPTLLDGLEARGAVATFFMCGANGYHGVVNHHDLLPRMMALGCEMANHSYSHPNFTKINGDQMKASLEAVEEYLYQAAGSPYLDLVRIPGGSNNPTIRASVNHPMILWSVDPFDWRDRNADIVYERIMAKAHDGAVVLLHDLYKTSIEGGLRAMDSLKAQGYTFVTVSELFRRRGIYLENGVVYTSAPNNGVTYPAYTAPDIHVTSDGSRVSVALSSSEPGVSSIHYTTDGSAPTLASPLYTGPFPVSGSVEVRAAGFDRFATRTPVAVRTVQTNTAAPLIASEQGGTITLSSATEGAKILYTTDGSDPRTSGSTYSGAFTPGAVTKAVAVVTGRARSDVTVITKTKSGALFYDLPADAPYFDAVSEMVRRGLMNGVAPYTFSPETPLTRAALVSVLYRLEGSPAAGAASFADVEPGSWYASAVAWAAANGIVTGKTDDSFDPAGNLSRQQAATILYRYANWSNRTGDAPASISAYPDADKIAPYAGDALAWCQGNGMLSPLSDGRLGPEEPAQRSQCAVMVSKLADMAKR